MMRTIIINRLNHGKTRKDIFGRHVTIYDTHEGPVKEICPRDGSKTPKYIIKRTRESVNVVII